MEMKKEEKNTQKIAEDLYSKINIDGKDFKSISELSANYTQQVQQIKKDSIKKPSYFLCK